MNVVFVHGGVSGIVASATPSLAHCLPDAVEARTALDAVELAVRALEDDPNLNAGYGAVLSLDGEIELDAGIADGVTGRVGGVANVRVRHPVTLARRVLDETPHVLVTGTGAARLGADLERLDDTTPEQRRRFTEAQRAGTLHPDHFGSPEHVDTVGAIAVDGAGRLAAASSTGGVFGKLPGRVGDAPIFGAGIYASESVAVVGTGVGELFLETLAAMGVGRLVEGGSAPQPACEEIIRRLGERSPAAAGLMALDASGEVGAAFRGGSWAVEGPLGPIAALRLE
jgi:beta-aspartyl-peptidase (threonine type)